VKCSGHFRKDPQPNRPQKNDDVNITANIIFNLAHLGISIEDSKNFDLETYFDIAELEMNINNGKQSNKRATQRDIDMFLL
jgi:hypothetical protein